MTSVGLTVPSFLSVSNSPITSSGTINITTTTTPSGSGAIVLQTSPTLVTPNIGVASGTSLSLSATTNSTSSTTGSLVNAGGLGVGGTVYCASDFISRGSGSCLRILGFSNANTYIQSGVNTTFNSAAKLNFCPMSSPTPWMSISATGIVYISSLTSSYSVHTNASKELVSVQNVGTGLNVLQTSPTLITPNIGIASGTSLDLSQNTITTFDGLKIYNNYAPGSSAEGGAGLVLGTPNLSHYSRIRQEIIDPASNSLILELSAVSSTVFVTGIKFVIDTSLNVNTIIPGSLTMSSLTASRLVLTDASQNLTSLSSAGTNGQVLSIVSGSPSWVTLPTPTGGTVTSVGLSVPSILSVTPSTITSSGTFAITTAVAPTGTGAIVLSTSPTLVTPNIGVASGTSLNLTSLTASRLLLTDASKNLISLSSAGTNGQVLSIVSGSPSWVTLPASTGGTVTSVGLSVPSIFTVSGSPITSSGTLAITTAVTPTGTGAIVLSTSPTLVTPNIGVASGTSLATSDNITIGPTNTITANRALIVQNTTSSAVVLGIAGSTGAYSTTAIQSDGVLRSITGNLILQSGLGASAIRITTSNDVEIRNNLNIGVLTASYSVHTDASKNLVSVQNSGSGLNIMQTAPTLINPNIGNAFGSLLALSSTLRMSDSAIYLRPGADNNHGVQYNSTYDGPNIFGFTGGALSYRTSPILQWNSGGAFVNGSFQVVAASPTLTIRTSANGLGSLYLGNSNHGLLRSSNDVILYTTSGSLIFRANGLGGGDEIVATSSAVTVNNPTTINGALTINDVVRKTVCWGLYEMTGIAGFPTNISTVCGNWGIVSTSGDALTYNSGTGFFTNNLGRDIYVTVSVSIRRDSPAVGGNNEFKISAISGGRDWAVATCSVSDFVCITATLGLINGSGFSIKGFQNSGFGLNFEAGRLTYVIN